MSWLLSILAPIALLLATLPLIGALERVAHRGVETRTTCTVTVPASTDEDADPADACWISDPGSD